MVAPSRFGYFGSTLPSNATPADQADVYAALLDHLGIDRAIVIGYSAASVLEFALRHAERVIGLILASARLGGGITANQRLAPAFRVAYSAQPLFWAFKALAPTAYGRMMGAPKKYRPTASEATTLAGIRELLFPLTPRRDGAVFDGFIGNLAGDRFPLERLPVPTLLISAVDDGHAPYCFAATAAARIPRARLVTIERGGHIFLGHETHVREAIGEFIQPILAAKQTHTQTNLRTGSADAL